MAALGAVGVSAGAGEADPDMLQALNDSAAELQIRDAAVKMLSKTRKGRWR